jgi:predicted MFS family arabinose efflux permease
MTASTASDPPAPGARTWPLIFAAAAIIMITTGARQALGLYVAPLSRSTGLGLADISLALAIGQLVWGATQPLFGAIAERYGPVRVIAGGAFLLAAGFGLTPYAHTTAGLILTLGVLSAAGGGAGSFTILIGATAARIAAERRSLAAGIINAGASFGQFVFAPVNLALIGWLGWTGAISTTAVLMLATLPLAWALRPGGGAPAAAAGTRAPADGLTLREQLRAAARDRSYWCLHLGFFTCGFHVAFLVTHLPTEVNLCGLSGSVAATSLAIIGLSNIAGSLGVGALASRVRQKWLLYWVYFIRAVAILAYLFAPRTPLTFYVFATVLGLTWLSTVPPTAGLVGKLFGLRHLSTLFGFTLLSHQLGGFFGAWLGGIAMTRFGDYSWMWIADIVLALCAALVNLPIREARLAPAPAAAGA